MARPTRIEFPGAVYHLSSHGQDGMAIFLDDADRRTMLSVLEHALERFDAQALAYCLLRDGYELVLFTRQANLSRLMRHINGVYTQAFNRRHGHSGQVLQGRFKGVMVDREKTLLGACQYVETSVQRAGLARGVDAWPWSSHRAHSGDAPAPAWLDVEGLQRYVLGSEVRTPAQRRRAGQRYASLTKRFDGEVFWRMHLRHQIYLGDEAFVARMRRVRTGGTGGRAKGGLAHWIKGSASREQGLLQAYTEGGLSMSSIADALNLSVSRVSRLIARAEGR